MLKQFRIPLIVNIVALIGAFVLWGVSGLLVVAILSILEVSFSFDNAIVNSKILSRMSDKWQRIFLTFGILIAVFGMRLLFPLIIVALTAHIGPLNALQLAIQHPVTYAHDLISAHTAIAIFGGIFLLMLFCDWLIEDREIRWLEPLEIWLSKMGRITNVTVLLAGTILLILSATLNNTAILATGLASMLVYTVVNSLDIFFNEDSAINLAKAGLATFLYLEVLDASFSFDGVVGAFAVSNNIFLIAIGLGIGAVYIRSLTVYLVRKGTLNDYKYLEHGAHWAIGVLALLLLATTLVNIPSIITGLIGLVFIGLAFLQSTKATSLK